jgi:hypothetical protein
MAIAPAIANATDVRTVALTGQQAPGMPSGANFEWFAYALPVLNDVGQTAFVASLTGGGVVSTNNYGIWSEGSGSLTLVAREGSHAPGTPVGMTFGDLDGSLPGGEPVLNNAGQVAFQAYLRDSAGNEDFNHRGIWSEGSGSLALVAHKGDPAPGTPAGVNYGNFWVVPPVLNDSGETAFYCTLTGSGVDGTNSTGIWAERSGGVELVARNGDHAPGKPVGVNFSTLLKTPLFNNAGQVAFAAMLTDGTTGNWLDSSGTATLVVSSGTIDALNNDGQIVFRNTNGVSVWSESSGTVALVASPGDQAPGTSAGVTFTGFDRAYVNDAGQTAFRARLAGSGVDSTNDDGIWSEGSGSLALIARTGAQAPGTPNGVKFKELYTPWLGFNNVGQMAFSAYLAGTGVDETNDGGIWATDRSGVLQPIVREGDLLEVAPGDFRTIDNAYFQPGGIFWGNSDGFNNLGQLAFSAHFTDGSDGIFVSNHVAVPEPSAIALVVVGISYLARLTHRRFRGAGKPSCVTYLNKKGQSE